MFENFWECDVLEAAIGGESGQKASCRPVHVQDMFGSFNLWCQHIPTYSDNIGKIKHAKQFCFVFCTKSVTLKLIFLQCTFLPKRQRVHPCSSKLDGMNLHHTMSCWCSLPCWKCSPLKVLPGRSWNCWQRATVWYIVNAVSSVAVTFFIGVFVDGCFEGEVGWKMAQISCCFQPFFSGHDGCTDFWSAACHVHFLGHIRCEFMECILIEKVLMTYLKHSEMQYFCRVLCHFYHWKSSPQCCQFALKVISACSKARQWSLVRWGGNQNPRKTGGNTRQPTRLVPFLVDANPSSYCKLVSYEWSARLQFSFFSCFRWCVGLFIFHRSTR